MSQRRVSDTILASLTPRQRAVYRLIGDGVAVKNIGPDLGITEATVRDHIKAVRAKLPNRSNETIARMLQAYEDRPPQNWGETPQSVEPARKVVEITTRSDEIARSEQDAAALERAPGPNSPAPLPGSIWDLLFPKLGRPPNELSTAGRIALILAMAIVALIVLIMSAGALIGFSEYLRHLARYGG
jgi:DNA-binding CsgD family transcriptional regulator